MTPGLAARKATTHLVVHCSASLPVPETDVKTIDRWHRQRGFLMVGYHYVIKTDGTVQTGRPENTIGAHVEGHNATSIGICMVGGVDRGLTPKDNFTAAQKQALETLLGVLLARYPTATIVGHRDFPGVKKACPSWDVRSWAKARGLG